MPRGRSDPGQGSGPPRYPGTFMLAFHEATGGMNWQVRRWTGDVVECVDANGAEHVVSVENLYRRARRHPREEWPELIAGFLESVNAAEEQEKLPTDLASAADRLLIRLGRAFTTMPDGTRLWSEEVGGTNLGINLVIDYPNSMSYVTEQLIADSGRPGAEWVRRALDNLRGRTPADCFELVHEESGILLCNVADAYDSSRALLLNQLLPEAGGDGYFVVLPGRDELLVLPVTAHAIAHVHLLKVLADKNFKTAPYPISDDVYWIRGDRWHSFRIEVGSKEVMVEPPTEFIEVLNRLAPDDEPGTGAGQGGDPPPSA